MGTPSSGLPAINVPTKTSDLQFPLANTGVINAHSPQLRSQLPAASTETTDDSESGLNHSEPTVEVRSFADDSDSGNEVTVIEHRPLISTSTSSFPGTNDDDGMNSVANRVEHALIMNDRKALQRCLGANPALVNAQLPELKSPPLVAAIRLGHREMIDDLLANPGIYIDARDSEHRTALHCACEAGDLALCKLLIKHGANLHTFTKDSTPLIAACRVGNPELIACLLKKIPRILVDFRTTSGKSALANCIETGNKVIVATLISSGANPNHVGAYGMTPLHYAVEHHRIEIAKLLLKNGAVSRKSIFGYPLDLACRHASYDMVKLLLSAPPDSADWQGYALQTAIESMNHRTLEFLLDQGLSPDATLQDTRSVLMIAAEYGNGKAARILIERGANLDYLSAGRHSALSKAIEKRCSRDLILTILAAMPTAITLDRPLAARLIRRAMRREDVRLLNELAAKQFVDRFGSQYKIQFHY